MSTKIKRKVMGLGISLVLLFPHTSFSSMPFDGVSQPKQMESRVEYDPQIFDPFFDEEETSWPWWIVDHGDGTFEDTTGQITKREDIPILIHTADCRTRHQGLHNINYCSATLQKDGIIELKIEDQSASTGDFLTIQIKDGKFFSQYKTYYPGDPSDINLIWTTTKQRLILNKKEFKKGEVIKGRVEFECVQEVSNPKYGGRNPQKIRIEGTLKPILE
jgi:hypothetical protein